MSHLGGSLSQHIKFSKGVTHKKNKNKKTKQQQQQKKKNKNKKKQKNNNNKKQHVYHFCIAFKGFDFW